MKEYDIFVPLFYNDGSPIEPKKFQWLQRRLLDRFDGLSFFPQPIKGYWKMGEVTYHDEIVIYRGVTKKVRSTRRFLILLKEDLKKAFEQEEIFIVERNIQVL